MAGFFQHFFKPKWQHSDHSVRIQAIEAGLDADTLKHLIKHDSHDEVKAAALAKTTDAQILLGFINDRSDRLSSTARQRYLEIITQAQQGEQQVEAIKHIKELDTLMVIAAEWHNTKLGETALAQISDENALVECAQTASSNKVRLLIADKVQSLEHLKTLEKAFKGKDKTAAKQVKAKIQSIEAEQHKAAEDALRINALLEQIQTLAASVFNPTYVGKLAHLKQAWSQENVTETQSQSFNLSADQCDAIVAAHEAEQKQFEAEQQKQQDANILRANVIAELQSIYDQARAQNNHDLAWVADVLKVQQQSWAQAAQLAKANQHEKSDYETLLKPLVNLEQSLLALQTIKPMELPSQPTLQDSAKLKDKIQKLLKRIQWPEELAKPKQVEHLEQQVLELDEGLLNAHKAEKQTLTALDNELSALENAVTEGNLKLANKLQLKVKQLIGQVEKHKSKPQQLAFNRIVTQLGELKDWQGFAAEPKFVALCDSMEQLASSPKTAQEQSAAIHELQEQWKALGSLGDKKRQDQLWLQFKAAADRAFEPCRQHFDEQAKMREFNRQQREAICESLETLYTQQDWSNADYKGIQRIIDKAYHEYKSFAPVDRDINKPLQDRFNQASTAIKNQLKQYYSNNAERKQALIDECNALLELDNLADATEQCKALQQTWKTIENAGRQENTLWTDFRQACDAVFAKRHDAYQAKRSEQDAAIAQGEALVKQVEQLPTDKSSLQAANTLKDELKHLDLPPKVKAALLKKVDTVCAKLQHQLDEARTQAEKAKWENVFSAIDAIARWEASKDETFPELDSATLPKAVAEALLARESQSDLANTERLSDLCFEIEITAGIESPKGQEQARMAYQVKKLQSTMGTKPLSRQESLEQAILSWCAVSALSDGYADHRKRFEDAASRALGMVTESA